MKYITCKNNKYVVDRKLKEGRVTVSCDNMASAVAVRDIFNDNGWVLDLSSPKCFFKHGLYYVLYKDDYRIRILFVSNSELEAKKYIDGFKDTSNISLRKNGRYHVQKCINNHVVSFGFYRTLDEAMYYRDLMREHGWDKEYFDEVYKYSESMRDKYIFETPDGKFKVIKVGDKGTNRTYGTFKDKESARKHRDYLIKHNWVMSSSQHITRLFGKYWIFTVRFDYENMKVYRLFYDYSDDREELKCKIDDYVNNGFPDDCLFETSCLQNIALAGSRYNIERKGEYVYSNDDLYTLIDVRDILRRHDWVFEDGYYNVNKHAYHFFFKENGNKTVELMGVDDYDGYVRNDGVGGYIIVNSDEEFVCCCSSLKECKFCVDFMLRFDWDVGMWGVVKDFI